MRRTIAFLLGALLLATSFASVATAKHGTTDTDTYKGPAPFIHWLGFPPYDDVTGVDEDHNLGGLAFSPGDADNVQVEITDDSGLTTSGLVEVINEKDRYVAASDAFCGTSETLNVPSNATTVRVFVGPIDGIALAEVFADEAPPVCPGPGTTGTITASWG